MVLIRQVKYIPSTFNINYISSVDNNTVWKALKLAYFVRNEVKVFHELRYMPVTGCVKPISANVYFGVQYTSKQPLNYISEMYRSVLYTSLIFYIYMARVIFH